jgi:hypothetical protein
MFAREAATVVEPARPRAELAGLTVQAPDGFNVSQVLPFRRQGARVTSALAWLVPAKTDAAKPPGELYSFSADAAPRRLLTFPAFVPTLAGCQHRVQLTRTGHDSATLDVQADCPDAGLPDRTPTRAVLVVAPDREPALLHELRLAQGVAGETFDVAVDSKDVDQDGHDDVTATFSLSRQQPDQAVAANVVWLSRAAGVGRDDTWPAKSFTDIASLEAVRSTGRNTSEDVPERVQNARRLMADLCAELASPRVSDDKGRNIDCGDLQRTRDLLAEAEVKALLTRQLDGEALLAEETADWYGELSDAALTKLRNELESAIRAVAVTATKLDARPRDPGPSGTFSPLAFAADGALLVQTSDGVYKLAGHELENADEEVDPWPLVGTGPHSERWLGLSLPCEKPFVEIQGQSASGAFETLLEGRWLAPRPSQCSGRHDLDPPPVRVVRWDSRGLGVLFGSAFWGSQEALSAPALGSPVSANGKNWVTPTHLGLFVQHETSSERWTFEREGDVSQCVIADDGDHAACVQGGAALLLERPAQPSPATDRATGG